MASTYLQNLQTRQAKLSQRLALMEDGDNYDKPNATGDGTHVDHVGARKAILDELNQLDGLIRKARETEAMAEAGANEPFFHVQGMRPL